MALAGLWAFVFLVTPRVSAQTETILYSFGGVPGDGAFPYGGLLY